LVLLASVFSAAQASTISLREEQHRATFTIVISNPATSKAAGCSASALSEHVLLTAAHCDIPGGFLHLNQTARPFTHPLKISDKFYDHQDHMLLVVPDVSFKHFIRYDPATYKKLTVNDHYYLWGNPGMIPNQYREGYVTGLVAPVPGVVAEGELDVVSPFVMFSGPVVGGDSGSAVFAEDGRLAGVLTYGVYYGMFAGSYPLSFTVDQVNQAKGLGNFVYAPDKVLPVVSVTVEPAAAPPTSSTPSAVDLWLPILVLIALIDLVKPVLGGIWTLVVKGHKAAVTAGRRAWQKIVAIYKFVKNIPSS
jgi:hypothetical protein